MGPDFDIGINSTVSQIFGNDESGFYMVRNSRRSASSKCEIERVNNKLVTTKRVPIPLEAKGKHLFYHSARKIGGKPVIFSTFRNGKTKKRFLFAQFLHPETLKPAGKVRLVKEVGMANRLRSGYFFIKESQDKSKLMVLAVHSLEKKENLRISYVLLDHTLEKIKETELTLPYSPKDLSVSSCIVLNNGTPFLLARIKNRKSDKKGAPHHYKIFGCYDNLYSPVEYFPGLQGGSPFSVDIASNKSDEVFYCGFYGNDKKEKEAHGTFFMKIDGQNRKVLASKYNPFQKYTIMEGISGKEKNTVIKKGEKGINNLVYRNLIPQENGGAILVGEQLTVQYKQSGKTGPTIIISRCKDILITDFSPDGNIVLEKRIDKFTTLFDMISGGFSLIKLDDTYQIIYGENEKGRIPSYFHLTIDADGNTRKSNYQLPKNTLLYLSGIDIEDKKRPIILGRKSNVINSKKHFYMRVNLPSPSSPQ
ncbi:hypothetical protein [Fulvitalea axinellae]